MERLQNTPIMKYLSETGIVAIARGIKSPDVVNLAEALYRGGIRAIEVTLNTVGAPDMILELHKKYGDRMWIGAGTVLNIDEAQEAMDVGAQFFVTPNINNKVIDFTVQQNIPIFPGALTPSEIVAAYEAGATAVKVFPSCTMGSQYFREIQGPLSHIPLMAVGGISTSNAAEFLAAGAMAIGVGGSLVNLKLIMDKKFTEIEDNARKLVSIVKFARQV